MPLIKTAAITTQARSKNSAKFNIGYPIPSFMLLASFNTSLLWVDKLNYEIIFSLSHRSINIFHHRTLLCVQWYAIKISFTWSDIRNLKWVWHYHCCYVHSYFLLHSVTFQISFRLLFCRTGLYNWPTLLCTKSMAVVIWTNPKDIVRLMTWLMHSKCSARKLQLTVQFQRLIQMINSIRDFILQTLKKEKVSREIKIINFKIRLEKLTSENRCNVKHINAVTWTELPNHHF